jgi:hypothetical protein
MHDRPYAQIARELENILAGIRLGVWERPKRSAADAETGALQLAAPTLHEYAFGGCGQRPTA